MMMSKKGISLIQIEKYIAQGLVIECSITHTSLPYPFIEANDASLSFNAILG